jgi:hypothetical protein
MLRLFRVGKHTNSLTQKQCLVIIIPHLPLHLIIILIVTHGNAVVLNVDTTQTTINNTSDVLINIKFMLF